MNIKIHYGHIGRTEAVEQFINEHLEKLAEKYGKEDMSFEVWIERVNPAQSNGAPLFSASIELLRPSRARLYVKKEDETFHKAFKAAEMALGKGIRRDPNHFKTHHRVEHPLSQVAAPAPSDEMAAEDEFTN